MKYILITSIMMMSSLFARSTNPETGWFIDQSQFQAFYMLTDLRIDDAIAEYKELIKDNELSNISLFPE